MPNPSHCDMAPMPPVEYILQLTMFVHRRSIALVRP